MGVVDKTVDTAGGAVTGGVKGGILGFVTPIIGGAIIGVAAVTAGAAFGGVVAGVGAAAAIFSVPTLIFASVAAIAGGAAGGGLLSVPVATTFAAIGALFGGAKRLLGGKSEEPSLDQQITGAKMQNNELIKQLAQQQAANDANFTQPQAAANDANYNPDAKTGWVSKVQGSAPQQAQAATGTDGKPSYVAKTQTTTTTVEPQRA